MVFVVVTAAACGGNDDGGETPPPDAQPDVADAVSPGPDASTSVDGGVTPSFLYAADGRLDSFTAGGMLYRVDVATGAATSLGSTGRGITGLAHAADGTLYATEAIGDGAVFSDGRHWLEVEASSGAVTEMALQEVAIADLAFLPDGELIGWIAGDTLGAVAPGPYAIDLATGAYTALGSTDVISAGSGLAVDEGGVVWLAATRSSCDGATLFRIDPMTGLGEEGPTLSGCPEGARRINSLAFHRGVLYGVTISAFETGGTTTLVSIDRATGAVTAIGELPVNVDAIASGDPATVVAGVRATARWQLPPSRPAPGTRCPNGPPRTPLFARGDAVPVGPLAALAAGDTRSIRVVPCDGPALEYPVSELGRGPDSVRIARNRRGTTKLVVGAGRSSRTLARALLRVELR